MYACATDRGGPATRTRRRPEPTQNGDYRSSSTQRSDFNQLIDTRVQGNNPPDVALFPQPGIMKDLATRANSRPLEDVLDIDAEAMLGSAGARQATASSTACRSASTSRASSSTRRGVGAAGYTRCPKTLDELIALTDQIKATAARPWCIGIESGAATGWPATDWIEDLMLSTAAPTTTTSGSPTRSRSTTRRSSRRPTSSRRSLSPTATSSAAASRSPATTSGPPATRCSTARRAAACSSRATSSPPGFFPEDVLADLDDNVGVFGFPPADGRRRQPGRWVAATWPACSARQRRRQEVVKYLASNATSATTRRQTGSCHLAAQGLRRSLLPERRPGRSPTVAYKLDRVRRSTARTRCRARSARARSGRSMTAWISGQRGPRHRAEATSTTAGRPADRARRRRRARGGPPPAHRRSTAGVPPGRREPSHADQDRSTRLIAVVGGIGGALVALLGAQQARRAAARASGRTGSSRTSTSCPAFAAIALYLIYPAIQTSSTASPTTGSTRTSASTTTRAAALALASSRRCSTRCCGSSSCRPSTVVLGLAVAVLADRLGPRARSSPRRSSSCRWRSAWSARRRSGGSSTRPTRRARPDRPARTPS